MIRPATVRDVPAIAQLINSFAERGQMLFRSHAELYETLRDFVVYEAALPPPSSDISAPSARLTPSSGGSPVSSPVRIVGVCALEIVWADLAEVKSLAVERGLQGRGIGRQLVEAVVAEARRLEIQQVFALTYEQAFFARLGFHVVDRAALPLKVWSDCIRCPKRDGCDEIAVVRRLFDTPAVTEEDPNQHAALRYEVPTPLVQLRLPEQTPPPS